MNMESNVPEVQVMFKELMEAPEKMFEIFRINMKQACERAVTELIKTELTHFLGREKYERNPVSVEKKNYRNGSYKRNYAVKNVGELEIKIARDRNGEFNSKLINKYERYEKAIEKDLVLMFLSGLSTFYEKHFVDIEITDRSKNICFRGLQSEYRTHDRNRSLEKSTFKWYPH